MRKKTLRFLLGFYIGKLARRILKILGKRATTFPGRLATKICPDFLGIINKPKTIVAVTGTNGKTTVCNLLVDILIDNGYSVLDNRTGSNLSSGIASSLLAGSSLSGKAKNEIAIFEIDERYGRFIYPYVIPDYVVCTNLFRDSLKRNANAEFIADIVTNSIPKESKLILNGDDLISGNLAPENERVYFSIDRLETDLEEGINIINDIRICPKCNTMLQYEYVRHHHIGRAHCPSCDFGSPESDYVAKLNLAQKTMIVEEKETSMEYGLISDSIFNINNQVTAIATLRQLGLEGEKIKQSLENMKIVETRYSHEIVAGIEVITHMAKERNPIACSCVFDYLNQLSGTKEIILLLDDIFDKKESSENITWYYDADFEFLNSENILKLIIGGVRAKDYRLRLLIAGVPDEKIVCVEEEADTPDYLELEHTEKVIILHEVYAIAEAMKIKDRAVEIISRREEKNEN